MNLSKMFKTKREKNIAIATIIIILLLLIWSLMGSNENKNNTKNRISDKKNTIAQPIGNITQNLITKGTNIVHKVKGIKKTNIYNFYL